MADLTLRATKGAPLTNLEIDTNFTNINDGKVDKVTGKSLSTEDYTTTEKNKLAGIAAGAQVNINADWNAVEGNSEILNKPNLSELHTHTNKATIDRITEAVDLPLWNGETWPSGGGYLEGGSPISNYGGVMPIDGGGV